MPRRNVHKFYVPDNHYHVYNRGLGKMDIFCDSTDYRVFLSLLKRALGSEKEVNKKSGYVYPNFHKNLKLQSFCLMPNHFHMLVKTNDKPKQLGELLRSVITAYSMYFNKKYNRTGPLFGSRYRAVRITDDAQLLHISRYIHLNPLDLGMDYFSYEYSSLQYLLGSKSGDWVDTEGVLCLFNGRISNYIQFLKDYTSHREALKSLEIDLY